MEETSEVRTGSARWEDRPVCPGGMVVRQLSRRQLSRTLERPCELTAEQTLGGSEHPGRSVPGSPASSDLGITILKLVSFKIGGCDHENEG